MRQERVGAAKGARLGGGEGGAGAVRRLFRDAGDEISDSEPAGTVDPDAALEAVGVARVADEAVPESPRVVGTSGNRSRKLLGGKGRVIVLRYNVGSQSSHEREEGFLAALAKEFPAVEVISSNEYAGDTADKALVKSQQLLLTFGDRVDGVFTPAQHVSTGMLRKSPAAE